jgi:hypothetical protein
MMGAALILSINARKLITQGVLSAAKTGNVQKVPMNATLRTAALSVSQSGAKTGPALKLSLSAGQQTQ